MAFMAFMGIAYTQRLGGHIRMDMLLNQLHGKRLWLAELISSIFMFFVTIILIYGSYLHFLRAYTIGDSSLDIDLPVWPAKLIVPVALTVLALRLLLQMWAYFRALIGGNYPIAVPLTEDTVSIAIKKAEFCKSQEQD